MRTALVGRLFKYLLACILLVFASQVGSAHAEPQQPAANRTSAAMDAPPNPQLRLRVRKNAWPLARKAAESALARQWRRARIEYLSRQETLQRSSHAGFASRDALALTDAVLRRVILDADVRMIGARFAGANPAGKAYLALALRCISKAALGRVLDEFAAWRLDARDVTIEYRWGCSGGSDQQTTAPLRYSIARGELDATCSALQLD